MTERQEKLTEMQKKVLEGLQGGRAPAAKAALTRSWRDAVPDLPVRFSVVLRKTDAQAVAELLRRARRNRGSSPPLRLRKRKGVIYVETVRGARLEIGQLPRSESQLLSDFGADAKLYRPQLLEVRYDDDNRVRFVAIELVRPELFQCPSCDRRHKGPHAYCSKCRAAGEEGEGFEHTPVQIHEAIEAVIADGANLEDDLPI
jgi:hypothetical protein